MKKIDKREAPEWFERWKNAFYVANGRKAHYKNEFSTNDAAGAVRRERLKRALIEEQGSICCYCMKRITVGDSHIEHFYPKDRFGDIDMDYNNLFASCNGEGISNIYEEHCGHRKDNWWRADVISPTDIEVEKVFKYSLNGEIHSVKGRTTSDIAEQMIREMGLDSFYLERERRRAIENSEVFDDADYSEDDIREFVEFYSHKNNGEYVPYCKAIIDCLINMI